MSDLARDRAEALDDLLSRWHSWQDGEKLGEGHAKLSAVVGECRGYGLQYESQLEQQHAESWLITCRAVNTNVRAMEDPHRAAIYCEARNLVTGHSVWDSPRLPRDPLVRAATVVAARAMLMRRLMVAGLIE